MLQKRGMSLENRNEVRKNFGRRAANYRLSATHGNKEDLERMISLLNPAPAAAALDVATGGGHTAAALSRYVRKVTAVDITPECCKKRRRWPVAARKIFFKSQTCTACRFPAVNLTLLSPGLLPPFL